MAKIKPKKNVNTKKVAVGKSGKEKEINTPDKKEIQDGVMPTNAKLRDKPPVGYATIGLSLGATLNMDNFESARVDVFIQRNVEDKDEVIRDEYDNLREMLTNEIEKQSAELLGEDE